MIRKKLLSLALAIIGAVSVAAAPSDGTITGKVSAPGLPSPADTLVYLASVSGSFSPGSAAQMNQQHLAFVPRVLPIVVGTKVDFVNGDDLQHNVFTPSPAGDLFNLGTWPKGEGRSHTFDKMGKVEVRCNVHHEMKAYVLVLQNPFFALTDANGSYRIPSVPPGTYQLKVWNERASASPRPIEVTRGGATADFTLTVK